MERESIFEPLIINERKRVYNIYIRRYRRLYF